MLQALFIKMLIGNYHDITLALINIVHLCRDIQRLAQLNNNYPEIAGPHCTNNGLSPPPDGQSNKMYSNTILSFNCHYCELYEVDITTTLFNFEPYIHVEKILICIT